MASDLAPSVIVADNDGDDLSPITDEVPGRVGRSARAPLSLDGVKNQSFG